MPEKILAILHLEDDPNDALLIQRTIQKAGIECTIERVNSRPDFIAALDNGGFDIILLDYSLPGFDGFSALTLAKEKQPDTPVLLVTGSIGEELAAGSIKQGAYYYVLKDRLGRLVPAIRLALQDAANRTLQKQTQNALQEREKKYRTLFENMVQGVFYQRADGALIDCNSATLELFGLTKDEFLGRTSQNPQWKVIHEDGSKFPGEQHPSIQALQTGKPIYGVVAGIFNPRKNDFVWLIINAIPEFKEGEEKPYQVFVTLQDITAHKQVEEEIKVFAELGHELNAVSTEKVAAHVILTAADKLFGWDCCWLDLFSTDGNSAYDVLNIAIVDGRRVEALPTYKDDTPAKMLKRYIPDGARLILRNGSSMDDESLQTFGDKSRRSASLMFVPIRTAEKIIGIISIQSYTPNVYTSQDLNTFQSLADYTGIALDRIRIEQQIKENMDRYQAVMQQATDGIFLVDFQTKRILEANPSYGKILGYTASELQRLTLYDVVAEDRDIIDRNCQRVYEEGQVYLGERKHRRKNGTPVDTEVSISFIKYSGKEVMCRVVRDITARKRLEMKLADSEHKYRDLVETAQVGVYQTHLDGRILFANKTLANIFEFPLAQEVIGTSILDRYKNPVDRKRLFAELQQHKKVINFEIESITKNKKVINVLLSASLTGEVISGMAQDITPLKKAQEQIRLFNDAIQSVTDCVSIADLDNNILFVNAAFEKTYGLAKHDLLGKNIDQLWDYFDQDRKSRKIPQETLQNGSWQGEVINKRKNGELFSVWLSTAIIKNSSEQPIGMIGIARDITDQKKAEKWNHTFEELSLQLAKADTLDSLAIPVAKAADTLLNYDAFLFVQRLPNSELFKMAFAEDIINGKRQAVELDDFSIDIYRPMGHLLEGEPYILNRAKTNNLENWRRFGDESRPSASLLFAPVCFGKEVCGLISVQSYTPQRYQETDLMLLKSIADTIAPALRRVQIENVLRESEANLKEAQRIGHIGSWQWDITTNETLWSEETYRIFGLQYSDLKEQREKSLDLIHPEDRHRVDQALADAVNGVKEYNLDYRIILPDGTIKAIHAHAEVLRDSHGKANSLHGTVQDITDRKRAEENLQVSQEQLRALASHLQSIREEERTRISREIHDELGQSLTALKMDTSWLGKRLTKEQPLLTQKTKDMDVIIDRTIKTVKRITSELRPGLLDDLGLAAALDWQANEFSRHAGIAIKVSIVPATITLNREATTGLFRIFQETLTNIARHAHATRVTVSLVKKQIRIVLTIKDNGKGITQKQINSVQSLGLIGIRERVGYLEGTVEFKGIKGKGTTVVVQIPIKQ